MMMFKQQMADLIFAGKKTETRRLFVSSSKNYAVGSIQPVQTSYRKKAIGHIKILDTYLQRLSDMTDANVRAEGFDCWADFMEYLDKVNETHMMPDEVVKVYRFEVLTTKNCPHDVLEHVQDEGNIVWMRCHLCCALFKYSREDFERDLVQVPKK